MEKEISLKDQTIFGFYGSLRKGEYNYVHLLKDKEGVEYMHSAKTKGYKLYSLGSFPVILPSGDDRPLTIDLFKITNPVVKGRIDGMEIGAGYERKLVTVGDHEVLIYVGGAGAENYVSEDGIIPDGDWSNRNNTRRHLNVGR